jgi:hypothetical protein
MFRSLLFAILIFSQTCFANDYLEPEDNQFTGIFMHDYYEMVINYLSDVYAEDVVFRVIVFPSFYPEYAIAMRKNDDRYYVQLLSPEKQLWGYKTIEMMKNESVLKGDAFVRDDEGIKELESKYPQDYLDIPLKKCSAPLNHDLALQLTTIWETMLLHTRYQKKDMMGLDGVTYHYSMRSGHKDFAGKVWSPDPETKTGKLVTITEALAKYCETPDPGNQKALSNAAKALLHEL